MLPLVSLEWKLKVSCFMISFAWWQSLISLVELGPGFLSYLSTLTPAQVAEEIEAAGIQHCIGYAEAPKNLPCV